MSLCKYGTFVFSFGRYTCQPEKFHFRGLDPACLMVLQSVWVILAAKQQPWWQDCARTCASNRNNDGHAAMRTLNIVGSHKHRSNTSARWPRACALLLQLLLGLLLPLLLLAAPRLAALRPAAVANRAAGLVAEGRRVQSTNENTAVCDVVSQLSDPLEGQVI